MKTGDKSEPEFQSCNLDSAKCVSECVRDGEGRGGGRARDREEEGGQSVIECQVFRSENSS